jgi:hypothetical protein
MVIPLPLDVLDENLFSAAVRVDLEYFAIATLCLVFIPFADVL